MFGKLLDEIIYPFPNFNGASLGKDMQFHPAFHHVYNYLSMLGLKWIHISKRGPSKFQSYFTCPNASDTLMNKMIKHVTQIHQHLFIQAKQENHLINICTFREYIVIINSVFRSLLKDLPKK